MTDLNLDVILRYWESPTGQATAPPGMVELARRDIRQLCDEVERLRAENARLQDWAAPAASEVECRD